MPVNEELRDHALRHAIYSERFGKGLARRMVALLDEADDDLTDRLTTRLNRIIDGRDNGPATTRRLTEIVESLRSINDRVYRRVADGLEAELTDFASFEIENQSDALARIIPVEVTATTPTPAYLQTLVTTTPIDGRLLSGWIEGMAAGRLARVEQALRVGMVAGDTVDQMVRRIRGTRAGRYRDGVLEISRRSATTLALTANSTIANAARERVYQDNARLISRLKWLSTLDSRTSPTCQARDGRLYDLDKPHPTPPAHPRCRSVMMPVTVPFSALGLDAADYSPRQRASMDGQVPGNTTFGDWLAGQPRSRVEAIMGKERAELFLSKKLPFKEFFDKDDAYYSLADLRAKSGLAPKPKAAAPAPSKAAPAQPKAAQPKAEPTLREINAGHDRDLKVYTLENGRRDGKEHLAIYDSKTGRTYDHVSDGKKSSVEFPPWMMAELQNPEREIILHHNHPSSSSFSPADLRVVTELPGAKGIWAHGHNGSSYYAEAGPRKMSVQTYDGVRRMVQQWVQSRVNMSKMSTDDANLLYYHVVTRMAAHRGYLKYEADLQGPTLDAWNRNKSLVEEFIASIAGHAE